jgi:oxygen-independent coproporphyrinogen-3 oxidase
VRPEDLEPEPGTPLYVHLPFCAAKCPYCDFYSLPGEGEDTGGAIETLLHEAAQRAPRGPRTVFFGGGTPSYHSIAELERLLDGLDRITGFRSSAEEVTLECNPESLFPDKAAALRSLGATRLSIGFQSLDPATLALFGRVHTRDQSLRAYAAARGAGFRRVNIDLIFGAPGEAGESWERTLNEVLALGPEHISAYGLTFEEGTPFHAWRAEGRVRESPEEDQLALFRTTREQLARAGYRAYEISNFALSGEECRHNLNYWRNGPYVGIGPSAASKVGHRRFARPRSIARWRRAVWEDPGGELAWTSDEELAPAARLGETWWLGLRLAHGVDPAEARRTAGFRGAADPAASLARELVRMGELEEIEGRFRLAPPSLVLADAIAARFLAPVL